MATDSTPGFTLSSPIYHESRVALRIHTAWTCHPTLLASSAQRQSTQLLFFCGFEVSASYFAECLPNFTCLLFFSCHGTLERRRQRSGKIMLMSMWVTWHHHTVSTFITLWDHICQPSLLPFAYFSLPPVPGIHPTRSTPPLKCRDEWAWSPMAAEWPSSSSFGILLWGREMFSPPSRYPLSLVFISVWTYLYLLQN